ncbi:hypothetical protein CPC08DRAFT_623339 [Agrocybe pediades]|nr:hypothetical protein CPC08DRAFT_623339 [Agrocybe pediades]
MEVPVLPVRKRQNSKRCKPRSSSAAVVAPSSTSKAASSSSVVRSTPTSTPPPPPPAPTTSHVQQPKPSSSKPAAPATTKPAAPVGNLPSFMVGTQTGQGTFYATGLGACGITNKDTDHIAAVSHLLFDAFPGYAGGNPNNNPICGRTVTATYKGKSTVVALTDRCEGCKITDLDFSPSAFADLADFALGRLDGVTWVWND